MRHLSLVLALVLFAALGLALALARPEEPDQSLFGAEMALAAGLEPLPPREGGLSVRGRVRARDGSPAAEALVALLRAEEDAGGAEPIAHSYTDGEGRFEVAGLTPGSYRVLVAHPSAPPSTRALEVPVAGELELELEPPLPPLPVLPEVARATLAGALRFPAALAAADPAALAGFEVVLRPAADSPLLSGASERRATTAAGGGFSMAEVVAVRFDAEVLPPWARGGSWPVLARASVEPGAAPDPRLEIELAVGALEGEVREAAGRPLSGALVKVSALDARDPVGEPQLWPPSVTDAAGRFRVELLPPGRYLVHLRAGSAALDLEAKVEAGAVTRLAPAALDPRVETAPSGG